MSRRIRLLSLVDGARKATGLTVVIDVFRAFSLEAYQYAKGAEEIVPVMTVEEAFEIKRADPGVILVGERGGVKCEGFDFGNSPSQLDGVDVSGKRIVHTTSAGTRGLLSVSGETELLTAAFVNARAVAEYIERSGADDVSIVAMGLGGKRKTDEDELCAAYIRSILEHDEIRDIDKRLRKLKYTDGSKFFKAINQQVFPERDFWMSIERDIFDFVIKVEKNGEKLSTRKIGMR
ncbi:MAG: 2-phosphosulfolactate phosphatase [Oscillospiraceae bacterium]|nr:2-phosphosulfolactate phosphatase [Oscillospiraceae bacterium]